MYYFKTIELIVLKIRDGLKKNQIEQHSFKCRSHAFSCIDCNKDFKNEEYKSHVKCLTESERYESKSTFVAKSNKGDIKQSLWMDVR
jgi:cell growth-regulating nucleolar protein